MPLELFTNGDPIADTKAPTDVPIGERWSERKFRAKLVNPANRRKLSIIVVGTGLAGGSAAATLAEAGYRVKSFWFHDSPRRAHSVAAQGGINAAKNYRNDGDSIHRLFYDTVKGGDFRARESNVHRLAQISVEIIDQCVAQGVPFAREYGGLLDTRSFGVVLASGGYGNVFYLSTNAMNSNATAIWRAHRRGALFANPCFTQIHPTCIPVSGEYQSKLTLMSESLRNDGRIWVPVERGDKRPPDQIPDPERDYYLERRYPSFGNLVPRDVASRAAKLEVDKGRGVGPLKNGVYLDFKTGIERLGRNTIEERYGNLFEMYERITGEDPYQVPMRIYPAVHYTMGGLWVDYNLMSTIPGLFVGGEANFSDHGANRLGASALMQGLADGYFVLPYTVNDYLAGLGLKDRVDNTGAAFKDAEREVTARTEKFLSNKGDKTVDEFWKQLGKIMWNDCGMARSRESLTRALQQIPVLREEFHQR